MSSSISTFTKKLETNFICAALLPLTTAIITSLANKAIKSSYASLDLFINELDGLIKIRIEGLKQGRSRIALFAATSQSMSQTTTESASSLEEISISSKQQAEGIKQINLGLSQLELVASQNTTAAEQTAAASEQLNDQSMQLKETISKFTLRKEKNANNIDSKYSVMYLR